MTLPELLIAVAVVGLIIAVLSSTLIVTMRQETSTRGRFNVAHAEQSIGLWLPGDLASAAAVSTEPAWDACGHVELEGAWVASGAACPDLGLPGGSNALLIGWSMTDASGVVTHTNVSYYFAPGDSGLFQLTRIECTDAGGAWSCTTTKVLDNLPPPPPGPPFEPGVTRPDWVIQVSEPLAADGVDEGDIVIGDPNAKNAKRVIVTVNGGGSSDGAGGGSNQISITAGGTNRNVIDGTSLQGAPSFAEALSLCGGPMTLLVDESNSIGDVSGALANVKTGVREFITALIGTPVKLQVIGFHTYSHVLGTTEWHKYYDMTDEADVAALLASVDTLKDDWNNNPNGGTNWEEAFFRTFYAADGSTVEPPETVVFFTDGVPTFDRLVHKTDPGILPAQPPDPGPAWPDSTGSSYSQVAFDRANYIATQVRSRVRLVGVGIGGANTGTTNYTTNPGAGYHYLYEQATTWDTYEARYWTRSSWSSDVPSNYSPVTKNTYDGTSSSRRKNAWNYNGTISGSQFNSLNSTSTDSDGVRRSGPGGWTPVTKSQHDSGLNGEYADAYRRTKEYSAPFDDYEPPTTMSIPNWKVLGLLIAGGDTEIETATPEAGPYVNVETANLYKSSNWAQLPIALKSIALGECGGTLTLQTKLSGAPVPDPFVYQNSAQFAADGSQLVIDQRTVTTNRQFTTGNFDFKIDSGLYRDVVILPANYSDLGFYSPAGWSCRAGSAPRAFEVVDIPDAPASPWKGIKVRVSANEAVSCTQSVTR